MKVVPLKRLATLRSGGTPTVDDPSYWADDGVPWVSIGDMSTVDVIRTTARTVSAAGMRATRLTPGAPGTVLFAMYASVGAVATLGVTATWNQALLGVTAREGLADSRFLRYSLLSLRGSLGALTRSNTQDNLNADQVGNLPIAKLPLADQRAIADFLDAELSHIDALISQKRTQRRVLVERRDAVTEWSVVDAAHHRRKSCTLAWTTSLPAHWKEVKLTMVSRMGSGHTPSRDHPEWWVDCTIPWITTGEVAQMRSDRVEAITETREMISELGVANSSATVHPEGTVVLCRTAASAGYSAIMGKDMATSQDFATWTCGPLLRPRYLLLCLRAMRRDLLERLAMGSTHKTIYMPDIEAIRVPLPPVEEQDEIVERTRRQLRAIDKAVDAIEQHIGLLQERKQALITAAVTGQLDVAREISEEAS